MFYLLSNPRQAHQALTDLWAMLKRHAKTGAKSMLTWQTVNPHRRHQLRKALHGPVLCTIAEQVWLYDPACDKRVRYHPLTWKRYFAELFLPPEYDERTDPDTGEVHLVERRRSTEDLSDDEMAEFVARVQAWAVTDLGVTFADQEDHHDR